MKNDIKKYLTLGAVLAGSAFMVSCDGDDVTVVQDTGVADAINGSLGPKAVAPVSLASFPITSLKLAFDNDAGTCLGAAFVAGDEIEIDFDSTTATASGDISGDAIGDLDDDGGSFVANDGNVFIEGIIADPSAAQWTIEFIKSGVDSSGLILLSDLTFTPLASNQQSVSGRFTATAPIDVDLNQDDTNVVVNQGAIAGGSLDLPGGDTATIIGLTVYENSPTNDVEVLSNDGATLFEPSIGDSNYAVSLEGDDGCVYNFVISKAALIAGSADITDEADVTTLSNTEALQIIALMDVNNALDVGPDAVQEIADSEPVALYLTAGVSNDGVSGSYRHDFDSSTGASEPDVNQAD
jgi:hypothetical protein